MFNQAFADYEHQVDYAQLQTMLKRRGFNPDLSFAAFEGKNIVAFTLNGIGNFNGISTAYDTGTGTLKEYRGQGLATQIFQYSIPFLKEEGVKQYLLEVLQHNTKAISVYRNLGFEVSRELNYFIQKNDEIINGTKSDTLYTIKEIEIVQPDSVSGFWDSHPSWQNSFESIERSSQNFVFIGAFVDNRLAGYCLFEPASGNLTQLSISKEFRRKGIASLLLNKIVELNKNSTLRVINTETSCSSITDFLKTKNIGITGKQFEMIKRL